MPMYTIVGSSPNGAAPALTSKVIARWLKVCTGLVLLELFLFVPIAASQRDHAVAQDGATQPTPPVLRAETHRKALFDERQKRWREAHKQLPRKADTVTRAGD